MDLRRQLCFQGLTFFRTPASHQLSHVPTHNSRSRGYRNNDAYLSDTLVLSFNTLYLTDNERRLEGLSEFTEPLNDGHVEMSGKQPVFFAGKEDC